MLIDQRQIVVDAITACLAAGFNDAITANAERYGVPPFQIDFAPATSRSFVQQYVDPDQIELSSLLEFPGGCVYTDDSEASGQPYALAFSGAVIGCVDLFVRYRDGVDEVPIPESALNRIESAVTSLFTAYTWPIVKNVSTVTYSKRFKSQRRRNIPLSDGYANRVSIQAQFSVFIN